MNTRFYASKNNAVDINQIFGLMDTKDENYTKIWEKIVEETEGLNGDEALTMKRKYELIISVEFLLVRLRLLVSAEQIKVKEILNSNNTPPDWYKPFKERDVYLATFHQKLMEIREDISVLQKTVYSYNTQRLNEKG